MAASSSAASTYAAAKDLEACQPFLWAETTVTSRDAAAANTEGDQPLRGAWAAVASHDTAAANLAARQPCLQAEIAVTSRDSASKDLTARQLPHPEGATSSRDSLASESDTRPPPGAVVAIAEAQQARICAGGVADHDAAAKAIQGEASLGRWTSSARDATASPHAATIATSQGPGASQRQVPFLDECGSNVTDIERAAAALREEAAIVLHQATLASLLGSDLSLTLLEDDGWGCADVEPEAGLSLPEPEGEPLLSLTSEVLGECGYMEEDESVACEEDCGRGEVHQRLLAICGSPIQPKDYIFPPDSDEETDIEDASDALDLLAERETAAELLQLLTRGLFGEEAQSPFSSPSQVTKDSPSREAVAHSAGQAAAELAQPCASVASPVASAEARSAQPCASAASPEASAEARSAQPCVSAASPEASAEACSAAYQREELLAKERARKAQLDAFLKKNGYRDAQAPKRTLLKTKFPIHTAAKQGDAAMVQFLLEEGADPVQKTSWGKTAAQIARAKDKGGSHAAVLRALGGA